MSSRSVWAVKPAIMNGNRALNPALKDRALVFGGGDGDAGLVAFLKTIGFHVTTSGFSRLAECHKLSDSYIECDISNLQDVKNKIQFDYFALILPSCNDVSLLQLLELGSFLPRYNLLLAKNLMLKDRFREFQRALGLPAPRVFGSGIPNFPCIVKPNNLSGGKGVSICRDVTDLDKALKFVNPLVHLGGDHLIEELVEGSSHGAFLFFLNNNLVFGFVDDEYYPRGEFWVAATSWPSVRLNKAQYREIYKQAGKIWKATGIVTGLLHLQVKVSDDAVNVIEATLRFPGDDYLGFIDRSLHRNVSAWSMVLSYSDNITVEPLESFLEQYGGVVDGEHAVRKRNPVVRFVVKNPTLSDESIKQDVFGSFGLFSESIVWRGDRLNRILFVSTDRHEKIQRLVDLWRN